MSCFSNARRSIRTSDLGEVQVRSDDPEAREHDHVLNRQRDNALHGRGELVEIHIGSHDLRFIL